jgi:hypothetical protein
MCLHLLGGGHNLLIKRVHTAAFNRYRYRFIHLVAHDATNQTFAAVGHRLSILFGYFRRQLALTQNGEKAGYFTAGLTELAGIDQLSGGVIQTQFVQRLLQIFETVNELIIVKLTQFTSLH